MGAPHRWIQRAQRLMFNLDNYETVRAFASVLAAMAGGAAIALAAEWLRRR